MSPLQPHFYFPSSKKLQAVRVQQPNCYPEVKPCSHQQLHLLKSRLAVLTCVRAKSVERGCWLSVAGWFAWARVECWEGHRSVLEKTRKGEKRVERLWKPQVDAGLSHMGLYWNWSGFDMAQSAGSHMVAGLAKGVWYRLLFGWHFLLCYCFLFLMTGT